MYFLYKMTFPNGKIYIGISNNPARRLRQHINESARNPNTLVHNAIRKYGHENVRQDIICCGSKDYIMDLEIAFIKKLETQNRQKGYNITDGGNISPMHSQSVRDKVSLALRGRPLSDDLKRKMSLMRKGRVLSEETKMKLSSIRIGRKKSSEWKAAIGRGNTGKKRSLAVKKAKSQSMTGRKFSDETRQKMSDSHKRRFELLSGGWPS